MKWFMWRHCKLYCVNSCYEYLVIYLWLIRFGHHEEVTGIDCLMRERPVSSGGNDRTVRLWKILEETQLVFQGHKLV